MTQANKPYLSSALWPGIVLGLLSVIPIVNYGNLLCCLWIVGGGVLAAIVYRSETKAITPREGAWVGFLAGMVGAAVVAVGNGVLWFFFHETYLADINEIITMGDLDPQMIDMMAEFANNPLLIILISLISFLFLNAVFSTLGGFITATIINRRKGEFKDEFPPEKKEN